MDTLSIDYYSVIGKLGIPNDKNAYSFYIFDMAFNKLLLKANFIGDLHYYRGIFVFSDKNFFYTKNKNCPYLYNIKEEINIKNNFWDTRKNCFKSKMYIVGDSSYISKLKLAI